MPIEFSCSQCGKQLRTPDDSAGKQAKCPQCGAVMEIPRLSTSVPFASPAPQPANPFGAPQPEPQQDWNPYASPAIGGQTATFGTAPAGQLVKSRADLSEVFGSTWSIFKANMSHCLLSGLTLVIVWFVSGMIQNGIAIAIQGGINAGAPGGPPLNIGAAITAQLVVALIAWVIGTWLQLGATNMFLKLARGVPTTIGDVFSGGPFVVRGLLINLIFLVVGLVFGMIGIAAMAATQDPVVFGGVMAAFYVISLILYLSVALCYQLVIDRNLGAWESITTSMAFMSGNRFTLFVILLIVGIAGLIFTIVTCLIGSIAVIPYFFLVQAVFYLHATGQPSADRIPASY